MFNIAESIAEAFCETMDQNTNDLVLKMSGQAPLVINLESYGSMVETNKDSILNLYLGKDHVDIIQAKKNIALEAIDPKPDSAIKRCLETLVAATGKYSKIIIVDAPTVQEEYSSMDSPTEESDDSKSPSLDFGEAVKAAMSYQGVHPVGNVDLFGLENKTTSLHGVVEISPISEIKDHSDEPTARYENDPEEIPQASVEDDEPSQLIFSHRMSPEETETLFANAIADGNAKKKITIGAAGSTDPVIDDNAKNPILSKKKKGSGYINQNPNLHRGPKRPNMRA